MELDLDLTLSPHTYSSKFGFDFDLNKHCAIEGVASCLDSEKLRFREMFGSENIEEDCHMLPKPRLFSLNGQPNEEDGDPLESDSSIVYDEEENSEVVGWPPIKSCMTKYHNYRHYSRQDCDREDTNYTFTFHGKEGDWLLPGDVPWKIFAESVHRISITRDCRCAYTKLLF
ncbi:unnamed protein product [Thlaspi arvense]|uniref:Auxin-responsive protein n=1 Tax=Thlaspi arvense TaxID=13288 RepID=A0AAU9SZF4_THLAR|nr:unnamed protein product [Thlaspi arvense]